jgi:hypothetical protein
VESLGYNQLHSVSSCRLSRYERRLRVAGAQPKRALAAWANGDSTDVFCERTLQLQGHQTSKRQSSERLLTSQTLRG